MTINNKLLAGAVVLLGLFAACQKETAYPSEDAVNFNFYPASDVLQASSGARIYLDGYIQQPSTMDVYTKSPYFFRNAVTGDLSEFPQYDRFGTVAYVPYQAGERQVLFADDPANHVILDTTVTFAGDTYQCIYLADAPASGYRMLAVEEQRDFAPDGTTGVRFVHLSPDLGKVVPWLSDKDGKGTPIVADPLEYGTVTPYFFVDSTYVTNRVIQFTLVDQSGAAALVAGVPFKAGSRYAVVLQGFRNEQQREVNVLNADNTIGKKIITVFSNLRATARRIY